MYQIRKGSISITSRKKLSRFSVGKTNKQPNKTKTTATKSITKIQGYFFHINSDLALSKTIHISLISMELGQSCDYQFKYLEERLRLASSTCFEFHRLKWSSIVMKIFNGF